RAQARKRAEEKGARGPQRRGHRRAERNQSLRAIHGSLRSESSFSSTSRKAACAGWIFTRAISRSKNPARSTSGKLCFRPERGGHSISKRLLRSAAGSQSPSNAQACTLFPLFSRTLPSGR